MNPMTRTFALLLLLAATTTAQPLTLRDRTLRHPNPHGTDLYASTDLRHWAKHSTFTNETALPVADGPARFYRAKPRTGPVRILAILDLRQTIRGQADKNLTNIVAVGEGGTFSGWEESAHGNPTNRHLLGHVVFRLPPMPRTTNVTLTLIDDEGFTTVTNLVLDPTQPSDYKPKLRGRGRSFDPAPAPRPAAQAPAADEAGAALTAQASPLPSGPEPGWYITDLSSNYDFLMRRHDGLIDSTTFSDSGGDESWLRLRTFRAHAGIIIKDCVQHYAGGDDWWMTQTYVEGPCYAPTARTLRNTAEIASYDDVTLTYPWRNESERLSYAATTRIQVYVGTWNTTAPAIVRFGANLWRLSERYVDELVNWEYAGTSEVRTISTPDGSVVNATPTIHTLGHWYRFDMFIERLQ